MQWIDSRIVVTCENLQLLDELINNDPNNCSWAFDPTYPKQYLYGSGDRFERIDLLSTYAPYIDSGYVAGVDDGGEPFRYVFEHGTVKKMVPQWVEAPPEEEE
jgi:hypothetical protein